MRRIAALLALAGVLALAGIAAATAADPPAPAPGPTAPLRPSALVVAVSLGNPALQAGVLRGREVVLARGFEIAVARVLARRLGIPVGRLVDVRPPQRLLTAGAPPWHIAIAAIQPGRGSRAVALSAPYLTTDLAVVLRRGLARPRRLADLRRALLCVERGDRTLPVVERTVRPTRAPLVAPGRERLVQLVRTGACDAAVIPAFEAGRFVAGQRHALGPVAGRIRNGEGLVVGVARSSGIPVAEVNKRLGRLWGDGTLGRLARTWLGIDPARLPRLRY
jgi:ABC-type amino acid transport substrate-binding protein